MGPAIPASFPEGPPPRCVLGRSRSEDVVPSACSDNSVLRIVLNGALPPQLLSTGEGRTRAMHLCRPPCGSSNPLGRFFRKDARASESPARGDWWNGDPGTGRCRGWERLAPQREVPGSLPSTKNQEMLPRVWGFDRCRVSDSARLDYRVKSITSRLASIPAD